MKTRHFFELLVGIVGLISIFIFGEKGLVILTLLAIQPFIGKKKSSNIDYKLYYKINFLTFVIFFFSLTVLFYYPEIKIGNISFGASWFYIASFIFIIAHGLTGILFFKKANL